MKKKLLIIGHTFPEPNTTAAGSRMLQLIDLFQAQDVEITFASTAGSSQYSTDLTTLSISVVSIELNSNSFNAFLEQLQPEIVLFDRFVTEEQFGWRVAETCPNALRILDTEDLHFLRKAREEAFKKGVPMNEVNLFTETAKRELASIWRCDLSLLISEVEFNLLTETFQMPKTMLWYLPFLVASETFTEMENRPPFEVRDHFVAVGNLKHAPNVATVVLLKQKIWPAIRQHLPQAELHIYGAYAPQHIQEMHSPNTGFLIMGWAPTISEVMQKSKIQLAPLSFGAGLKGKILDAMRYGLPTVTTPVGAEGMFGETEAPGSVTDHWDTFVAASVQLYQNKTEWQLAQNSGFSILEARFKKEDFSTVFAHTISQLLATLETHRTKHFMGQILQHQSLQATKYLSKWIAEKNKN
tara:strand:- start:185159 stop:186394 length:1236 start_codon:yes stop_codon:yes gene_type:complete